VKQSGKQSRGGVTLDANWRLNERHYGALTGLNKCEVMDKMGAEWTMACRRGAAAPPPVDERHPLWGALRDDARCVHVCYLYLRAFGPLFAPTWIARTPNRTHRLDGVRSRPFRMASCFLP
jgi:hypothetical protein